MVDSFLKYSVVDYLVPLLLCLVFTYLIIPVTFKFYGPFSRKLIFLNLIKWPLFVDFTHPERLGLIGASNFYLHPSTTVKLGVWHILPEDLISRINTAEDSAQYLNSGHPIILYLHGNAGTRAGWHRIMLYKIFSKLNYHVICFDYRGFGDSIGIPSETGVVKDSQFVYDWIKSLSGNNSVILWGHSLGSGVTTRLARHLIEDGHVLPGVVLEAPFTNIADAAISHPISRLYRKFPWFDQYFLEPLKRNELLFQSDINIKYLNCPLLILHAKDDHVVPYSLGYKLYEIAKESAPLHHKSLIQFESFEAHFRLGHKHIHSHPNLPNIVKLFVKQCCGHKKSTIEI